MTKREVQLAAAYAMKEAAERKIEELTSPDEPRINVPMDVRRERIATAFRPRGFAE